MMPALLMPCYKDSLLYESLKFCAYVQKRASSPWGVSESAFYAFDPALNYSYKAHGTQRLALKRGMGKELVISPYSTFLALPLDTRGAVQNLKRLEQLGAKGQYGFYEALDFTPNRQSGGTRQVVRTYMAHHLGMSLLAIDNALAENVMQGRFMRDRAMSAYRELLQEKVPVGQIVLRRSPREVPEKPQRLASGGFAVTHDGLDATSPACTVLSNGAYSVTVAETGHSRSMAGRDMIARFGTEIDADTPGIGFYWKTEDGIFPLQAAPDFEMDTGYSAAFICRTANLTTKRADWESRVQITVPQNEPGEVRRVFLRNLGEGSMQGELICYFEPALAPPADYFAHPAFCKLSMETEQDDDVLLVRRRGNGVRRDQYLGFCVTEGYSFDTSRETALGRSGLYAAMERESQNSLGTVLDPCVLARVPMKIHAGSTGQVSFAFAAGKQRDDTILTARRLAAAPDETGLGYVERRAISLEMPPEEVAAAMTSVTDLFFGYGEARREFITPASGGQRDLWSYGISGDLPLITARLGSDEDTDFAKKLIARHSLLHACGIAYDLVFLVHDGGDYRRPVHSEIRDILTTLGLERFQGAHGGIHLIEESANVTAILAASAQILDNAQTRPPRRDTSTANYPKPQPRSVAVREEPLCYHGADNTVVIENRGALPPNTWSHMLANRRFGYIATESGTGHLWQVNARENKITPWRNDTLTTKGVERLMLCRDGQKISLFADADGHCCTVTYGFGFARWEKRLQMDGAEKRITTTAFVPHDTEARVFLIEGDLDENDKVSYFAELVLGADEKHRAYVVTQEQNGILQAANGANAEFPGVTVRLAASAPPAGYSCDRKSWAKRETDNRHGGGLDPCFYAVYPAADNALVLVLGTEETDVLTKLTDSARARQSLAETMTFWKQRVGGISVQTGDGALDRFLSGWALYQSLACRVWGRSSVYQCGGAYGFRDQLQDVTALVATNPEITREVLELAAAHQFEEGDVQHWWHPSGIAGQADKGVRTRCSDDLLFLPYVLCEYVEKTGDTAFCERMAGYIKSPPLEQREHERYESPVHGDLAEPIFDHAKRAIELVIKRGTGEHGLLLMGTGDWNDGMNLVGAEGRGESVWLTWFFAHVLERFAPLCAKLGHSDLAVRYERAAEKYGKAANAAWDGNWYLRGYFDNGKTLGSHTDEECQIDAIAQGFSTMTCHSDPARVKTAITSAIARLYDKDANMLRLFDPPFVDGAQNPGYIRGYAAGLRENGGQYTHGSLWLVMGAFRAGMADAGYAMLHSMLPARHSTAQYRGEPYVLAADVYGNPQHIGRAGWTWYTGAAAWYYRIAMEDLLGLHLREGKLFIEPNLPAAMDRYSAQWQTDHKTHKIEVVRQGADYQITVNGKPYEKTGFDLTSQKMEIVI